jgi:hypothetical protein
MKISTAKKQKGKITERRKDGNIWEVPCVGKSGAVNIMKEVDTPCPHCAEHPYLMRLLLWKQGKTAIACCKSCGQFIRPRKTKQKQMPLPLPAGKAPPVVDKKRKPTAIQDLYAKVRDLHNAMKVKKGLYTHEKEMKAFERRLRRVEKELGI